MKDRYPAPDLSAPRRTVRPRHCSAVFRHHQHRGADGVETGHFFINVGNYADSGVRAVEDGKLCTKPQKSKAACHEMRPSAGSLLLKRDNGQLAEFVAK